MANLSSIHTTPQSALIAAIDLGSNSFHLLAARSEHGELRPIETLGEKVQLASGLKAGQLSQEAIDRGLLTLSQFKQVLDRLQPEEVRVVGTNALRAAKNAQAFVRPAEKLLECPIEVISGREEARLVYLGVAHTLADDNNSRLVVDIGGGSTEFIIGQRFEPMLTESLHMGCVSYRERFFKDDKISKKQFNAALKAAAIEVLKIARPYKKAGWSDTVGSSGTMRAVAQVAAEEGLGDLTPDSLKALAKKVLGFSNIEQLKQLKGMKDSRLTVFLPGLAIISAVVDILGIKKITPSAGALREGLAYDLLGRFDHENVRARTVSALIKRYVIDEQNSDRVTEVALRFFDQVKDHWKLSRNDRLMLEWAAQLHEIGLAISHSQFHKHGQYLIESSDLAGFSKTEQRHLGILIRGHRQKFPTQLFQVLDKKPGKTLSRLCLLLRLATIFKYVPLDEDLNQLNLIVDDDAIILNTCDDWLLRHPLSDTMLRDERLAAVKAGFDLKIH